MARADGAQRLGAGLALSRQSASSRCSIETYSSVSVAGLASALRSTATELVRGLASAVRRRAAALLERRQPRRTSPAAAPSSQHGGAVGAELVQHGRDDAGLLVEQRQQQVRGRDLRVAVAPRRAGCAVERLLGLDGESVRLHSLPPASFLLGGGAQGMRVAASQRCGSAARVAERSRRELRGGRARALGERLGAQLCLALELLDPRLHARELASMSKTRSTPGEVHALVGQLLDAAQRLDVVLQ